MSWLGLILPNPLRRLIARAWTRLIDPLCLVDLMIAYEKEFPGRCGYCGYLRVTNQRWTPHEPCKEGNGDHAMMEEPVPCPGCGEIVELEAMRQCRRCRELFCKECLDELKECGACRERVPIHRSRKP